MVEYTEIVLDHFKNPRNVGEIENPDGIGHITSPVCGDIMDLYIQIKNNVIVDVKYKTYGCGAAIASGSMLTEMIKDKTIEEALRITNKRVADALGGLPPVKMHCSVLAEDALKNAIDSYLKKTTGKGLEGWKPRNQVEEHGH